MVEATAEEAWLYTRGAYSIRVSRLRCPDGRLQLSTYGPGNEMARFGFAEVTECMRHQAEIERLLVALGYRLARS
jgi:hypothetical protein